MVNSDSYAIVIYGKQDAMQYRCFWEGSKAETWNHGSDCGNDNIACFHSIEHQFWNRMDYSIGNNWRWRIFND